MTAIQQILSRLRVGTPRSQGGLTVVPLFDPEAAVAPGYLTLDEALAARALRVTEVSEAGSVPRLRVENLTERPVLLVDGEELIGGKQNPIVNLTTLVPGRVTLEVPVSCVEGGRWQHRTAAFSRSPQTTGARTRAFKTLTVSESLRSRGSYDSDQGTVWTSIADTAVLSTEVAGNAMAARLNPGFAGIDNTW